MNELAEQFRKFAARLLDARACIESFRTMTPGEELLVALDQLQGVSWRLYRQVKRVRCVINRQRKMIDTPDDN